MTRQQSVPKTAPKEVVDAAIFLRREAIKTLALAQLPAVDIVKVKNGVSGPVAFHLLRVLAADNPGQHPPFSLAEKCEAAVGVSQLKSMPGDLYRREVGVYLIGSLIVEFLGEYRADFPSLVKGEGKKIPLLPWKYQADRLLQVLGDLKLNTPNDTEVHKKLHKVIDQMAERSRPSLTEVRNYKLGGPPALLTKLLASTEPKSGAVYEKLADYDVQLRGASEQ
jgi:hypothetical protein